MELVLEYWHFSYFELVSFRRMREETENDVM